MAFHSAIRAKKSRRALSRPPPRRDCRSVMGGNAEGNVSPRMWVSGIGAVVRMVRHGGGVALPNRSDDL